MSKQDMDDLEARLKALGEGVPDPGGRAPGALGPGAPVVVAASPAPAGGQAFPTASVTPVASTPQFALPGQHPTIGPAVTHYPPAAGPPSTAIPSTPPPPSVPAAASAVPVVSSVAGPAAQLSTYGEPATAVSLKPPTGPPGPPTAGAVLPVLPVAGPAGAAALAPPAPRGVSGVSGETGGTPGAPAAVLAPPAVVPAGAPVAAVPAVGPVPAAAVAMVPGAPTVPAAPVPPTGGNLLPYGGGGSAVVDSGAGGGSTDAAVTAAAAAAEKAREDKASRLVVYWERQQAAFCGIHAVNNALQVPLFRESDFEEIAHKMDTEEALLMGMAYKPPGWKSTNVDDDGNYSIGVLCNALRKAQLDPEPLLSERAHAMGAQDNPAVVGEAYICHRSNHYFALRRLHGMWFNLDSLLPAPQLYTTVQRLASEGYTVYIVLGKFPKPITEQPPESQVSNRGLWFDGGTCKPIAGQDVRFKKSQFAWQIGPQKPTRAASYNDAFSKARVLLHQAVMSDQASKQPGTMQSEQRQAAIASYKEGCSWLLKAIEFCADKAKKAAHMKSVDGYLTRIEKLQGEEL